MGGGLFDVSRDEVGAEGAGLHERDADAERREFLTQAFAEKLHRSLRAAIHAEAGIVRDGGGGAEVDDVAAFLRAQHGQRGADDIQRAEEVRFEALAGLFVAAFLDGSDQAAAGVVHEHVKGSGLGDDLAHVGRVGDIERGDAAHAFLFEIRDAAHITSSGDYAMTGRDGGLRQRAAESGRAARDEPGE